MGKCIFVSVAVALLILSCSKQSFGKEVSLTSKNFQKEFLQTVGNVMRQTAADYLNNFLKDIKKPAFVVADNFDDELKLALQSQKLEPKVIFIKQYLDMAEHKDTSRANMYGLRNVIFLKKLKDKFYDLQEQSFEEIHQLRYFYLCKQFKIQQQTTTPVYHNFYSRQSVMAPLQEEHMADMLTRLGLKDNHTVTIDIGKFGENLYEKVKESGAEVIDDYLVIIRKLLIEVLEPDSEEETVQHSDSLRKILNEIDALLNIKDFYKKRQRLYDYLQNQLALDYEQVKNSNISQHDLKEISEKLEAKGLDLVVAYLFSNFEFLDHLHDHWQQQLPPAPLVLYDINSRPLKRIQQLYNEFKQDSENSAKYDAYLEAVKELHEKTQAENVDSTHIYEMLYNAAQNAGSSRATLMNAKCNEI